jgi:hypothetical protein
MPWPKNLPPGTRELAEMQTERDTRRSILVPIDLHGINRSTLETLVRIARQLDRKLLGLMLEDIRLQQVADLPFATEISLLGGRERSLVRDHLSQRQALVTTDTRRTLDELAKRDKVELVFEHAAGSRLHSALERDGSLDIFFPARQRWQRTALVRPVSSRPIRRLGIVLADSPQDQRILEITRALLQAQLIAEVYVLGTGSVARAELASLYLPGSRICLQPRLHCDPASISCLIRQNPYDLLLLPGDCLRDVPAATLDSILDRSGGQVLVIN